MVILMKLIDGGSKINFVSEDTLDIIIEEKFGRRGRINCSLEKLMDFGDG